jgi:chromosome segregation ATPase
MQDTIKLFKKKIDKAPNLKEISHRCFLYFAELYYMVAFVLADTSEVVSLKVLLSKQLAKTLFQLEDRDTRIDELTNSVQTFSKSRDFLFDRCEKLENKVNNLTVSIADYIHDKKSLELTNSKLKEDLHAREKKVFELASIVKNLSEEKVKYKDAKERLEGMSLVLADIYTAVLEVDFPVSIQSELFSMTSN